jgi:hypothetical protein
LILNWKAREGSATYFRESSWLHEKWVDENKKPDGSDYDIYKDGHTLIPECNCMLKKAFSHGKSSGRIFYSGKRIKRSICRYLRQRNAAHFDQCNESIKPMVCFKISRKAMKRL